MLQIVVVHIPFFKLLLQVRYAPKLVLIVELLLVLAVTSLDGAVLRGFSRVNELVDDVVFMAELIKGVNTFRHSIKSLVCARISVGENEPIVSFDCPNFVFET